MSVPLHLQVAWRSIRSNIGPTVFIVLILGLACGAATTIVIFIDRLVLRPANIEDPSTVITIGGLSGPPGFDSLTWWKRAQSLEHIASYWATEAAADGSTDSSVRVTIVSADFTRVLRVRTTRGSTFDRLDPDQTNTPIALISDEFWAKHFEKTPAIVNSTIRLDGQPYSIVGVLPPGFDFPLRTQVWLLRKTYTTPVQITAAASVPPHWIARIRRGYTIQAVRQELYSLLNQLNHLYGPKNGMQFGDMLGVHTFREMVSGDVHMLMLGLFGSTVLALLIAGANCSGIMLGVAFKRRTEFQIRQSVGASTTALLGHMICEAGFVSLFSGVVAFAVASFSLHYAALLLPPRLRYVGTLIPLYVGMSFCVAFLCACAVALGGALPAIRVTVSADASAILKQDSMTVVRTLQRTKRYVLIGFELAATYILVVLAGLSLRTALKLSAAEFGFAPSRVNALRLMGSEQQARETTVAFLVAAMDDISSRLGHTSIVGTTTSLPLVDSGGYMYVSGPNHPIKCRYTAVAGDYFGALAIRFLDGTGFDGLDNQVVIINRHLAEQLAVQQHGRILRSAVTIVGEKVRRTVVGIVDNIKSHDLRSAFEPEIYVPLANPYRGRTPGTEFWIVTRSTEPPTAAAPQLHPDSVKLSGFRITRTLKLADVVSDMLEPLKVRATVFGIYGALSALLSITGLYSVVSLIAGTRTREMGIYMACGAGRLEIIKVVAGEAVALCLAGLVVGVLGAWMAATLVRSLLYGIAPFDEMTFIAAGILLLVPNCVACIIPAYKIANLSPRDALHAGGY